MKTEHKISEDRSAALKRRLMCQARIEKTDDILRLVPFIVEREERAVKERLQPFSEILTATLEGYILARALGLQTLESFEKAAVRFGCSAQNLSQRAKRSKRSMRFTTQETGSLRV